MAYDVSSRREARRRRILENSENRLQKITGRNVNISKGNMSVLYYVWYIITLNTYVFAVLLFCTDNENANILPGIISCCSDVWL
jgi:hypothetical protein